MFKTDERRIGVRRLGSYGWAVVVGIGAVRGSWAQEGSSFLYVAPASVSDTPQNLLSFAPVPLAPAQLSVTSRPNRVQVPFAPTRSIAGQGGDTGILGPKWDCRRLQKQIGYKLGAYWAMMGGNMGAADAETSGETTGKGLWLGRIGGRFGSSLRSSENRGLRRRGPMALCLRGVAGCASLLEEFIMGVQATLKTMIQGVHRHLSGGGNGGEQPRKPNEYRDLQKGGVTNFLALGKILYMALVVLVQLVILPEFRMALIRLKSLPRKFAAIRRHIAERKGA